MIDNNTRYKNLILIILGLIILCVYGYNLYFPYEPYFDEVHYVKFIRGLINDYQYLETSNVHPPLWHMSVAFCMKLFGDVSWAWRFVSLWSGLAVIFLTYKVALQITKDSTVSFLACFLLVFDCLSLTQARIAMMNSFMLLFMLASLLYFLRSFPDEGPLDKRALRLSGIFFGVALASKLVSLSVLFFFACIIGMEMVKRKGCREEIGKNVVYYLGLFPIVIFLSAHIFIPFLRDRTLADVWKIWSFHMGYNVGMKQEHGYSSVWWQWPLMFRPIWFYFKAQDWGTPAAVVRGIFCIGNPAIFWLIPVAVGNLVWRFFKEKSRVCGLVLLGFFSHWLPFAFSSRLQFFHYFYIAMPFVVMAVALLVIQVWRTGKMGRGIVLVYLILVAGMFVFWYPLLIGLPVSGEFYGKHIWFNSWI